MILKLPSTTIIIAVLLMTASIFPQSSLALAMFLAASFLLGYRIALQFPVPEEAQISLSFGIGLAIPVMGLLVPFALMESLPIKTDFYLTLLMVSLSLLLDIGLILTRKNMSELFGLTISSILRALNRKYGIITSAAIKF